MLVKLNNADQVLKLVCDYIEKHHKQSRLRSPHYINTQFMSPQWRICGNILTYRLPNGGKTIALINSRNGNWWFDPDGIEGE